MRGLLVEARKGEAANYLPAVAEGVMVARKEVRAGHAYLLLQIPLLTCFYVAHFITPPPSFHPV